MRASLTKLFILLFCLTEAALGWQGTIRAQTQNEHSRGEFESRIMDALEGGDEEHLNVLVISNRYKVYSLVCDLLDTSVKEELDGNIEAGLQLLGKAAYELCLGPFGIVHIERQTEHNCLDALDPDDVGNPSEEVFLAVNYG